MQKKELKRSYQRERRPMGVFQIRNLKNERILVVAGLEIQGLINRHTFALKAGSHDNQELQADWNELGTDGFAFEILDQMLPRDTPGYDARADLASLKTLWLEKLQPYGERGYNQPEITRAERLRQIAARSSQ